MPLQDWKRYRNIIAVAVVESQNRITTRRIIVRQLLKTFIETDNRPSFSPQPSECVFKKRNRRSSHQLRLAVSLNLMKHYNDRSGREASTKETQFPDPARAVVQTAFPNAVHSASLAADCDGGHEFSVRPSQVFDSGSELIAAAEISWEP